MKDIEFNKYMRSFNKEYCALFDEIPCIQDYSCTQNEFIEAMKQAISQKVKIETILNNVSYPEGEDVVI